MVFFPIFAIVFFFILDVLELVFDIFTITAPAGIFISFLSTILYILWVFNRFGFKKGSEKLFSFKKKKFKKGMKLIGGSVLPFVTTWAVWDDYREEIKEKSSPGETEIEGSTDEAKAKKGPGVKGKLKTAALIAATGGAGAVAVGARGAAAAIGGRAVASGVATRAGAAEAAGVRSATRAGAVESGGFARGQWMRESGTEITRQAERVGIPEKIKETKTISEEVGGIKTGLRREDYDFGTTDFSRPETYEKLLEERDKRKKEENKKKKDIKETRQAKLERSKIEKREAYDREFIRRFGTAAYERMQQARRMREGKGVEDEEVKDEDSYREKSGSDNS